MPRQYSTLEYPNHPISQRVVFCLNLDLWAKCLMSMLRQSGTFLEHLPFMVRPIRWMVCNTEPWFTNYLKWLIMTMQSNHVLAPTLIHMPYNSSVLSDPDSWMIIQQLFYTVAGSPSGTPVGTCRYDNSLGNCNSNRCWDRAFNTANWITVSF